MNLQALLANVLAKPLQDVLEWLKGYSMLREGSRLSFKRSGMLAHNGWWLAHVADIKVLSLVKESKVH